MEFELIFIAVKAIFYHSSFAPPPHPNSDFKKNVKKYVFDSLGGKTPTLQLFMGGGGVEGGIIFLNCFLCPTVSRKPQKKLLC